MRKAVVSSAVILTLLLTFFPAGAGAIGSGTDTVYVDDDWTSTSCGGHTWDVDATNTIQRAIQLAHFGDTILVYPGTYVESGQIVIDKNLIIRGDASGRPVVKPAQDTGNTGDSRGWWLVQSGCVLQLENLELDGAGRQVYQAVRSLGPLTVQNCSIHDIAYPGYQGMGIVLFNNGTVQNNVFARIGRIGVIAYGSDVTAATITGNTYTGKGAGDCLDYAVEVGAGAQATVTGNVISACSGVASSDGSTSAGILVTTYYGAGTRATAQQNAISACTAGIAVGYDAADTSVVQAHSNSFTDCEWGITSTAPAVDGTLNWWGSASGPAHASNTYDVAAQGCKTTDHVSFVPWLNSGTDSDAATVGFQPGGTAFAPVTTTSPVGSYASVQAAVDASDLNGSVYLAAGTFSESQVLITKSLTLAGAGAAYTSIDGMDATIGSSGTIRVQNVSTGTGVAVQHLAVIGFGECAGSQIGLCVRGTTVPLLVDSCSFEGNCRAADFDVGVWEYSNQPGGLVTVQNCEFSGMWNAAMFEIPRGGASFVNNHVFNLHLYNDGAGTVIEPRGAYALTYDGNTITAPINFSGNRFEGLSGASVHLRTYGAEKFTNVTISGNTIGVGTDTSAPWRQGICLLNLASTADVAAQGGIDNAVITGNTITGPSDAGSYGIIFRGQNDNATITGNIITGVGTGLEVAERYPGCGFASGIVAHRNSISGNTVGAHSGAPDTVDASVNWWGDASGADHEGDSPTGSGDSIVGLFTHEPWYVDGAMTIASDAIPLATATRGRGSITVDPDQATYAYGTSVELTAVASYGWYFSHWEGSLTGKTNPQTLTIDGLETVTAVFAAVPPPPPPPPPSGSTGPFEEESEDGVVEIDVPAGICPNPVTLTIASADDPPPTGGNPTLGAYEVTLTDVTTGSKVHELTNSITITFHYTAATLAAAGISDPHDLRIWYWDTEPEPPCWVALPTVVDEVAMTISATVDHLTTFAAMVDPDFPALPDIAGHWAEADILRLASLDAVSGFEDGTFRPEVYVTRSQFAKFIVEALGIREGGALPAGYGDAATVQAWAVPYVAACVRDRIMTGSDGLLRPNDTITRAEAAVMVVRALGLTPSGGTGGLTFADSISIPAWAGPYVAEAAERGLITGLPGNVFDPSGRLTRAQAVTILAKALDLE